MPDVALPASWQRFLVELDQLLADQVTLVCCGGFAIRLQYPLPRLTGDLDAISIIPDDTNLLSLAGRGSRLWARHRVYVDYVAIATLPYEYEDRIIDATPAELKRLTLKALDPYDLALSKLERNQAHDRDDIAFLGHVVPLDLRLLRDRYRTELRPYVADPKRSDRTIELWVEMLEATQ